MTLFRAARARAIGLFTAVSIGGATIGLVAGGMLTQWVSWRWVFFVNVPIGLALIGAAALVLTETPRRTGHFDIAGALTSTAGMTALVYGFVRAAEDGWSDTLTIGVFAMGALLLGTFLAVERRAAAPITPLRLFADRTRASSYLVRLLLVAGMMGMFFFLTQFCRVCSAAASPPVWIHWRPCALLAAASHGALHSASTAAADDRRAAFLDVRPLVAQCLWRRFYLALPRHLLFALGGLRVRSASASRLRAWHGDPVPRPAGQQMQQVGGSLDLASRWRVRPRQSGSSS
jgi:MFS family permease